MHIQVATSAEWNAPNGCVCCTPKQKRAGLEEDWGISSTEDWRRQQELMIDDDSSNPPASLLLEVRHVASQAAGRPIDASLWRDAIARICQQQGFEQDTYEQLVGLAGLILHYEKRFTADGLLAPGNIVPSIMAWDFGRGANMARWGVQCDFTDIQTSQWYAVRAGEQSRRYYTSWSEFSAGYILGRCLHFDDGEFGHWYTTPLEVHRVMMNHPQSPWRHMPFRF